MKNRKFTTVAVLLATLASPAVLAQAPAAGAQKVKAEAAKAAPDPFKGLQKSRDDMRGITWYRHPSSPKYTNSNGMYLYFGKEDNGTILPLRLVAQYAASDWLFINRAWAKADGKTVDVPSESKRFSGWERDNGSGGIWEWSDTALTDESEKAAARSLANAKKVVVRYEGSKYYNDRTLSETQLKAMRDVIGAYEAVTGKAW